MWLPLPQRTTVDLVAARIVGQIAAQRLRPGDRLPAERDLASMLGVSRPSLREALSSLQARGEISIQHGRGAFVSEPTAKTALRKSLAEQQLSVRELYDMREAIEPPAAEWAARRQDLDKLDAVQSVFDELEQVSGASDVDYDRLQALDASFHLRIVEAANNRFLSQTLGVLQEVLATGMRTTLTIPGRLRRSRIDHERILLAVLRCDPAGARRAAKSHVIAARRAALARLEANDLDATIG